MSCDYSVGQSKCWMYFDQPMWPESHPSYSWLLRANLHLHTFTAVFTLSNYVQLNCLQGPPVGPPDWIGYSGTTVRGLNGLFIDPIPTFPVTVIP